MSELVAFAEIGFHHIVAWDAADHILFLLVLAAIYRGRDWRAALAVISAFTVGHSVTLALAVTNTLTVPSALVEFLIPLTIVATGIENLVLRDRAAAGPLARHRPVFAALFGLVHGAGFAGYLKSLFVERIAAPLLGFNLGIEAGQIVVLLAAAVAFAVVDRAIARGGQVAPARRWLQNAYGTRLVVVSAVVVLVAGGWAVERFPR